MIHISKPALVTLALGLLGGSGQAFDTEDIAIKVHELAPTAFAWRRYPERINLELVRVALVDASRAKAGPMVQGRGRGGWLLTREGVSWYGNHAPTLLGALHSPLGADVKVKRPEPMHQERERIRLAQAEAWKKWSLGLTVTHAEAARVFRIDQYTPSNQRVTKVRGLASLFEEDPELSRFIADMAGLVEQGQ